MTPKSLIEPARHAGTSLLRSQSDARLVDLTRDGNERAFEAIVQRYSRPLLRYCSRLLPPARAEDAVQQAFLSAHRAIHAGDADLNLRPWLYRIAHNASLNLLRQNGFDHEQVSDQIDGVETPPQAFERGEQLRTVVAAVQDLPERQRSAIVLQAVEGRSYDEIAVELGVTDGAVRQLLNRARTTLREGVTALTPSGLLMRLAGGEAAPVAERVAQVLAGAGGGALLTKAAAAIVVAGAVAGGAAVGGSGDHSARGDVGSRDAAAVSAPAPASARDEARLLGDRRTGADDPAGTDRGGHRGGASHRGRDGDGRSRGEDELSGTDEHGSSSGGGDDSHSGSGSLDDHSGPGSGSGDGGGSSGSGSGDSGSGSGSGSSGSGSGDGGGTSGSSGSGSSGTGSGDGGTSGSSGSGSSGSGSSGTGSGDGGTSDSSGSGSSGTSGSGDATSGDSTLDGGSSGSGGGGTSGSGRR